MSSPVRRSATYRPSSPADSVSVAVHIFEVPKSLHPSLFDGLDKQKNYTNITSITDVLTDTNEYRESLQAMVKNKNNELEPIVVDRKSVV